MPGKSKLTADAAEQTALRALSKSEQRGEADRARAILLTLEGRRAEDIAAGLGVHISTVRHRRGLLFAGGGGAARRGHRRGFGGAYQHGAQLAGLLYAWRSGGAAAAPEARTAGQDRATC